MFPKIHLVTEGGGVLGLDASVTQQRLEDNLNVEADEASLLVDNSGGGGDVHLHLQLT